MTRSRLVLLAMLFIGSLQFLQAQRNCAAQEVLQQQLQQDPALQQRMDAIEQHVAQYVQNHPAGERAVVTIPVVFHVLYRTTSENVSDAQLLTQLDVLNADFRKLNADVSLTPALFAGLAADCEVNFCMAQRTPTGAATTGITRKSTTVSAWGTNDNVKKASAGGVDPWNRDQYLNIWVCNIGGGILGYAQFPGGAASTDGVVLDYRYTGTIGTATAPFNKGRTATHEVGHWLNLRHIWGDANCGSDQVSDTPTHNTSNGGCPVYPHASTCSGAPVEMTMNYMDYTDDACMYMFSNGQKARMQAVLASGGARASLATSPGCTAPSGGGTSCGTATGLSTGSITSSSAVATWGAVSGATSYTFEHKLASATTWTVTAGLTSTSASITGLAASTSYNWRVTAVCGTTTGTATATQSFTTLASGGSTCSDTYEANNSRTAAKVIPVNADITAQIATASDVDWYRFSNTTATPRIKVDLTTLPADYDVKLFRNSTQQAVSQNTGTTSEQIIFNTTTVSTSYYVNVYGYQGAFSNTQCYTLRVSLSSSNWRTDGTTDGEVTELEIPVNFVDQGFGLFPNPATSLITLDIPAQTDGDAQVSILDMSGRAVLQQNLTVLADNQNRFDIPVVDLASGMYYVQVRNGDRNMVRKLVIQN